MKKNILKKLNTYINICLIDSVKFDMKKLDKSKRKKLFE